MHLDWLIGSLLNPERMFVGLFVIAAAVIWWMLFHPRKASLVSKHWRRWGIVAVGFCGLLTFLCGVTGYYYKDGHRDVGLFVYETVQLFLLNANLDSAQQPVRPEQTAVADGDPTNENALESSKRQVGQQFEGESNDRAAPYLKAAGLFAGSFVALLAFEAIGTFYVDSLNRLRAKFTVQHVVVCGYGRIGRDVVENLLAEHRKVIVIDNSMAPEDLKAIRSEGAIVVIGDAMDKATLKEAHVGWARDIVVAVGNDESNIEIATKIEEQFHERDQEGLAGLLQWRSRRCKGNQSPTIFLHLCDFDLADVARKRFGREEPHNDRAQVRIEIFNTLGRTVRLFLQRLFELKELGPSRFAGELTDDKPLHIIQFGFGPSGQGLSLGAAELCQAASQKRLRYTIFDRNIDTKKDAFIKRYSKFVQTPYAILSKWANKISSPPDKLVIDHVCKATFKCYTDVSDRDVVETISKVRSDREVIPVIVFCFEDGRENFHASGRLQTILGHIQVNVPIFTWLADSPGLAPISTNGEAEEHGHPIPFGLSADKLKFKEVADSWVDRLAQWFQYSYGQESNNREKATRHWLQLQAHFDKYATMGAKTVVSPLDKEALLAVNAEILSSWRDMALDPATVEYFRYSNRSAATHALVKLASVGLRVDEFQDQLGSPPHCQFTLAALKQLEHAKWCSALEHNRWAAERLLAGWSYHKNPVKALRQNNELVEWPDVANPKKDEQQIEMLVKLCRAGLLVVKPEPKHGLVSDLHKQDYSDGRALARIFPTLPSPPINWTNPQSLHRQEKNLWDFYEGLKKFDLLAPGIDPLGIVSGTDKQSKRRMKKQKNKIKTREEICYSTRRSLHLLADANSQYCSPFLDLAIQERVAYLELAQNRLHVALRLWRSALEQANAYNDSNFDEHKFYLALMIAHTLSRLGKGDENARVTEQAMRACQTLRFKKQEAEQLDSYRRQFATLCRLRGDCFAAKHLTPRDSEHYRLAIQNYEQTTVQSLEIRLAISDVQSRYIDSLRRQKSTNEEVEHRKTDVQATMQLTREFDDPRCIWHLAVSTFKLGDSLIRQGEWKDALSEFQKSSRRLRDLASANLTVDLMEAERLVDIRIRLCETMLK